MRSVTSRARFSAGNEDTPRSRKSTWPSISTGAVATSTSAGPGAGAGACARSRASAASTATAASSSPRIRLDVPIPRALLVRVVEEQAVFPAAAGGPGDPKCDRQTSCAPGPATLRRRGAGRTSGPPELPPHAGERRRARGAGARVDVIDGSSRLR